MYAQAMKGDTKAILAFMSEGKEDWRRAFGSHALYIAAWRGFVDMVYALCREGVDVNYQDYDGNTGLMLASVYGRLEIIRCLINHGARADIRNRKGLTAFDLAKRNPATYDDVAALLRMAAEQLDSLGSPSPGGQP